MEKYHRLFLIMLLTWLLTRGGTTEAAGLTTPISAQFDNYYLDEAIVFVADGAGMSWLTYGEITGTVSMNIENMQSSQALDKMVQQRNLVWQSNQDILVVRSAAKGFEARLAYELTKVPVANLLQTMADVLEIKLVIRGKLTGEVSGAFSGTMKEAVNLLAANYKFKWSSDGKVIKVSPLR